MNSAAHGKEPHTNGRANYGMVVPMKEASDFAFDFSSLAHSQMFRMWIPKVLFSI